MRGMKAGDMVFVVPQRRNWEPYETTIVRVGRKYGYINERCCGGESPYDLSSGVSVHGDCNARINRHGFDVYRTREEFEIVNHRRWEFERLDSRLVGNRSRLIELPPDAVERMHAILDEVEAKKGGA